MRGELAFSGRRVQGARLEIVPDGSHGLVVERPADVSALVHAFLQERAS